jgi:lysophospholipase L1-like esterase
MVVRRLGCAFLLVLLAVVTSCKARPGGIIIFCAGDSITEQGYPRFLRESLRSEGVKARVLNHGRSGNTSAEYLSFLKGNFDTLRDERPDIVLVELGTNDVRVDGDRVSREEFKRNMREIVGIFRDFKTRSGGRPSILLASIPPVPDGMAFPFGPESGQRVIAEINPAIKAVCMETHSIFVDNHSLFAGSLGLLSGVHPGPEGYRAMARNWHMAMKPLIARLVRR